MMTRQCINGPLDITTAEINQMTIHGRYFFVHLPHEEFMASPFVEIKPPEGAKISAANIVRKIKTLDGSIRMVHLSLFKHHAGAAHITSWMLYEGRLTTAHLSLSHLLIFCPEVWHQFHDLLQISGINAFDRHHVSVFPLTGGHRWELTPAELDWTTIIDIEGLG